MRACPDDLNGGQSVHLDLKTLAPIVDLERCTERERGIYDNLPSFSHKRSYQKLFNMKVPNSETMVYFSSQFESGNLKKAVRTSENEYMLKLSPDTNSQMHT